MLTEKIRRNCLKRIKDGCSLKVIKYKEIYTKNEFCGTSGTKYGISTNITKDCFTYSVMVLPGMITFSWQF